MDANAKSLNDEMVRLRAELEASKASELETRKWALLEHFKNNALDISAYRDRVVMDCVYREREIVREAFNNMRGVLLEWDATRSNTEKLPSILLRLVEDTERAAEHAQGSADEAAFQSRLTSRILRVVHKEMEERTGPADRTTVIAQPDWQEECFRLTDALQRLRDLLVENEARPPKKRIAAQRISDAIGSLIHQGTSWSDILRQFSDCGSILLSVGVRLPGEWGRRQMESAKRERERMIAAGPKPDGR